jgi:hypothetical protein
MRTLIAALVGAALIAGSVGCNKKMLTGSPWARWGFKNSTAEPGAESQLVAAHRLLYALKFDSAQAVYYSLARQFPQSAEAHLGLSLADWYTGQRDTAMAEGREAFKLDSEAVGVLINYAKLMLPMRTGPIADASDSARYAQSEHWLLKAAASPHPFSAHAHIELWASYMGQGRLSAARRQAFELGEKHYYHQPLLDFAHNLLAGLDTNAILFTNGDNDTYPLWVLQNARDPFRPDVTVANLSLLNIPTVVKMMRDSLGLPVSFTDMEIDTLKVIKSPDGQRELPPAHQVVDNVTANAVQKGRPVYFAVTVRHEFTDRYPGRLVLEGLVNRVAESEVAVPVDVDRITENLRKNYRLGWPKTLPPWPQNMSPLARNVAPLAVNYANLYLQLAAREDSPGGKTEAAAAWPQAVTWLVRAGKEDAARAVVEEWLRRSPEDPAAKKLKAELEKTGKTP